jgi:DNA-binding transcriptional regulator YdaS (Cro superfamily)
MEPYVIAVEGLQSLPADTPKFAENAAKAINRTTERSRAAASREMRQQVAFKPSYLSRSDRLGITKKASRTDLEAIITGRHRPTSLAQFARGSRKVGARRGGVNVEVQPGLVRRLNKAFFIRLRAGNTDAGPGNTGLAIRLPNGQKPDRAYKPTLIGKNLWLLYGPSIDQVFDDVANDISPQAADFLEAEFLRLMDL